MVAKDLAPLYIDQIDPSLDIKIKNHHSYFIDQLLIRKLLYDHNEPFKFKKKPATR